MVMTRPRMTRLPHLGEPELTAALGTEEMLSDDACGSMLLEVQWATWRARPERPAAGRGCGEERSWEESLTVELSGGLERPPEALGPWTIELPTS
jgi:hypothetical protein